MRNFITKALLSAALGSFLLLSGNAMAAQPGKAGTTDKKTAAPATTAPTAQEIADAKAKGLVWVNTSTKVYHKDGQFYGTTKRGKFMTEDEAKQASFRSEERRVGKECRSR